MQQFTKETSHAIPIPLKDVDTDMIIPAQYLTSTSSDGYGQFLFKRLRDNDPEFQLNLPKYKGAKFIIAQSNFGCGSSREHAVWSLLDYGIRAIIAPSFADIFAANAGNNGLVLVELPEPIIIEMLEAAKTGEYQLTIDLANTEVTLPDGTTHKFKFDPFFQECIKNGYDNLDYLLAHKAEIEKYQQKRGEEVYLQG